jgi:hypothetical protein
MYGTDEPIDEPTDESQSAEALRKSIRDLLKEARGRTEELSAEEAVRKRNFFLAVVKLFWRVCA